MNAFSRGDTVYIQAVSISYNRTDPPKYEPSGPTYEVGTFLRFDALGNVVVLESNESSQYSKAIAVDRRIGLPVEVTFPAYLCRADAA